MRERAVLLTGHDLSRQDRCVAKVVRFFGLESSSFEATEFPKVIAGGAQERARVLCSAGVLLRVIENLEGNPEWMQTWRDRIHSVFVYAGDDSEVLRKLANKLNEDHQISLVEGKAGVGELVVSDSYDEFCGVLAGLRAPVLEKTVGLGNAKPTPVSIISAPQGAVYSKLDYQRVPIFLSTSQEMVDLDAELTSGIFDVRERFLSAVPIVLYIKWAFGDSCWRAPEANACVVIDDPLLKPNYGFVNFEELLVLMQRHRFATNIAFIPWNWRRSNPKVVSLFTREPEHYSISIHGCDHTRAEFGSSDRSHVYWKTQQALERMAHHESNTGIRHDRVMVFPQGIFSNTAVSLLKHTDLIGAVNTDTISADAQARAITIAELWDIAVMRYDNFPIFTRRSPSDRIENFAFDVLLGKPAVIGIHHDFCRDHCLELINFVERMNALKCPLMWRSLGEVVRRSYRQRQITPDLGEIEMYGAELRVENRFSRRKRFLIRKRESEASAVKEIRDTSGPLFWKFLNGCIDFEIELDPGQSTLIQAKFQEFNGNGRSEENLSYRAKTMLRRYLCEVRDNYIVKNKLRFSGIFG